MSTPNSLAFFTIRSRSFSCSLTSGKFSFISKYRAEATDLVSHMSLNSMGSLLKSFLNTYGTWNCVPVAVHSPACFPSLNFATYTASFTRQNFSKFASVSNRYPYSLPKRITKSIISGVASGILIESVLICATQKPRFSTSLLSKVINRAPRFATILSLFLGSRNGFSKFAAVRP